MTEKEKMLLGKIYDSSDPELLSRRTFAHNKCREFNSLNDEEAEKRVAILKELMPDFPESTYLTGPIMFDYGENIHFGERSYANFNLMILDSCPVNIGNDVAIGPNCSINTPIHPLIAEERKAYINERGVLTDKEYAAPITIKDGCWIAANVTICGGVTIGKNCVIGAGSVVTRDIPDGYLAAGNPCKPIRKITEEDSIYKKKELW